MTSGIFAKIDIVVCSLGSPRITPVRSRALGLVDRLATARIQAAR